MRKMFICALAGLAAAYTIVGSSTGDCQKVLNKQCCELGTLPMYGCSWPGGIIGCNTNIDQNDWLLALLPATAGWEDPEVGIVDVVLCRWLVPGCSSEGIIPTCTYDTNTYDSWECEWVTVPTGPWNCPQ